MKMLSALIQRRHTNVTVTRDFSAMVKLLAKILTSAIWACILATQWQLARITRVLMIAPACLNDSGAGTGAFVLRIRLPDGIG